MLQSRIIWFAIAFTTVMYAVVAYITAPAPAQPYDAALRNPIVLILYCIALMTFAAGFIVPKTLLRNAPARTRMILGLALFESCAIYGLVGAFIAHDWRIYLAPWAIAVIGFLTVFPGAAEDRAPV